MTYKLLPDGSLLDDERVIFFSIPRFLEDICQADHCFVCGTSVNGIDLEKEHVLPDWLLRRHGLFDNTIGLPNGNRVKYPLYKVPCCVTCNRNLGRLLEEPVSAMLTKGYFHIRDHLDQRLAGTFYLWLCLIYFKTHYKDLFLKDDLRKPLLNNRISDRYELGELHHIHCMARACYTHPAVDSAAVGSLFILHAAIADHYEHFDFLDLYEASILLLRSGDVALIAVLNDASICQGYIGQLLSRVTGPLSPTQLREILAHVAAANLALPNRPTFSSRVSAEGTYEIRADVPVNPDVIQMDDEERAGFGRILEFALEPFLTVPFRGFSTEDVRKQIRLGGFTVLFNADGTFNEESLVPAEQLALGSGSPRA